MIIVGITGAISHGKSSLADALVHHEPRSKHLESFFLVAEVIDAWQQELKKIPSVDDYAAINAWLQALPPILKRSTKAIVSVSELKISPDDIARDPTAYQKLFQYLDQLKDDPNLAKVEITNANKAQYRAILQWMGGYLVAKFGSKIWWDELIRRAQQAGKDGAELVVLGGVRYPDDAAVVRAATGKIIEIQRPGMGAIDTNDPTERERQHIKPDSVIINNGNLQDLSNCAEIVLGDLRSGQLKPGYHAR